MIETEERRIKQREQAAHEQEEADRKAGHVKPKMQEDEHQESSSKKEEHKKKSPKVNTRPPNPP